MNSNILSQLRIFLRKCIVLLVFLIGKKINANLKLLNISEFKKNFKKSSKLVVIAPGLSLSDLNDQDIEFLEKKDIFYLNYSFLNKVIKANNFIMEPHPNIDLYSNLIKDKNIKNNNIFIKGYASPSRILMTLKAIKNLTTTKNNIFLMDELYGLDMNESNNFNLIYSKYLKERQDMRGFLVYGPSLFYAISFAFACNYEELILLGFDFDNRYIYCEDINEGLDYSSHLCSVDLSHTLEPD